MNFRTSRIITFLLIIYGTYVVWDLAININEYMWDYRAYHYSAKCLDQNLNPYNTEDLSIVVEKEWRLPYVYPPLTLNFFKLFNFDDIELAAIVFLLFKVFVLVLLILTWKKILNIKNDNIFYFFILLSFNSPLFIDLRVGNISIFIQLLFWIGIYFYFRKKYILFCLFIILSATFKLIPIAFLLLILLTKDKRKYLYFISSSGVFLFYLLLNYLSYPICLTDLSELFQILWVAEG